MKYARFVDRISGDGSQAWVTHIEAQAARARGEDVLILSVGDPDVATPPAVVETAIARLRAGDTHYTPSRGRLPLREQIAAAHTARTGQAVNLDQIIVLCGAQNALFAAMMCIAGQGDEVIAFDPMYSTYPATLEASGAKMIRVRQPADRGFRLDLDLLKAAITPRTRAIVYCTPNNPTGIILREEELAGIAELARKHDLWLVADEVYAGLGPGGRVPSLAATLPDQVITLCSLSKSHAMTGWRAGWLVGPTQLAQHVDALVMCMLFGLPGFIQDAAVTAFSMLQSAQDHMRAFCAQRRDVMLEELRGLNKIRPLEPEAGMFMLLDIRETGMASFDFMRRLFKEQGVSIMDGSAFGHESEGFMRLCFAIEETTIREACRRIRRLSATL